MAAIHRVKGVRPRRLGDMIASPMSEGDGHKYFVLDTNVLLHNPAALFIVQG